MDREHVRVNIIAQTLAVTFVCGLFGCGGVVGGDPSSDAPSAPVTAPHDQETSDASSQKALIDSDAAMADASSQKPLIDSDVVMAACDHYFAAQYTRCTPALPASETTRIRGRFEQVCRNEMALPGSGVTTASLQACASALDASPCEPGLWGPPTACNFHGSLSGGAPCNEGFQCQSGWCQGTVDYGGDGQLGPTTCGTCAPFSAVGQVCNQGGCASDAICATKDPSAANSTYTCLDITQGDVGAACDDLAAQCRTGLYCTGLQGQCVEDEGLGASCGVGVWACAAPLLCERAASAATCGRGSAGAPCSADYDCPLGLGCVMGPCSSTGCPSSGTCTAIVWAAPGQACDGNLMRCLNGDCNTCGFLGSADHGCPPQGPDGGRAQGTCPVAAPDGTPNAVCDTFAEDFNPIGPAGATDVGTCILLDSIVCK